MTQRSEKVPGLFDLEQPAREKGPLEEAIEVQIAALEADGFIDAKHAGLKQLALTAARDVDRSEGRGAPSGRANLLRVMNEILANVPQPEQANQDQLDAAVEALRAAALDEELEGTPADVRA